ncbi:MAG: DUF3368 domain-containing protein [Chitinivibrionales bacterium]|nr:DUF3368 domain-containing protein [Chitinivibrionales bacterium]
MVPTEVITELQADPSSPEILVHGWIRIKKPPLPDSLRIIPDLGLGESAAIALALQSASPLLLLDDSLGRRIAKLHGLRITGTAGVLLKAKKRGIVPAVRPLLEDLVRAGFYLRPDHLEMLCRIADE